jgi:hypothetical protein
VRGTQRGEMPFAFVPGCTIVYFSTLILYIQAGPSNIVRSVHDSEMWDEFVTQDPTMSSGSQNIALAYSTDGVNPFRSGVYSLWPLTFKVCRHFCTQVVYNNIQ